MKNDEPQACDRAGLAALDQMHADIAEAQAAEAQRRGWDKMDVLPDGRLVEREVAR